MFIKSDETDSIDDSGDCKCNVLYANHSQFKFLPGTFGGIPENLILNLVIWLVLIILFTFLRKKAWDYGRLALVQKNDHRWTHLFYGEASRLNADELSVDSFESFPQDKNLFSWIKALFQIKNEQILKKNGPDALQYLSFQKHIIIYLMVVCVISLVMILPVNIQGQLEADGDFGGTTISNLDSGSQLIWVHVAFAFLFVPLGIVMMRHFSANLQLCGDDELVSRTLMISKIPKSHCHKNILLQHFQEAYSESIIEDIELSFDVRKLNDLDRKRETASHARLYCENLLKETGNRPKMRPYHCGRICICTSCPQVDALEYYTEEEQSLSAAVDREKSVSLLKPLGIAFVTFQTESMAESVYKDHQRSCKCAVNPLASSQTRQLKPHEWVIGFAPPPEDIYWENLSASTSLWYFKAVILNLGLFLLFFFLTTPTIILSYLDSVNIIVVKDLVSRTPILSDFLPTLLLLVISVILPVIVRYSDQFMSHWTRSSRNHSIMVKTYVFLLFMVVILPLLQLTSVKAFLVWTIQKGETCRWQCVFMSGNGAFFVNYIITAGFIGTALELIRFPELLMYLFYMCFSRSAAEQASLRKAVQWEFEFGVQYAWFLLIFSVIIIYSLVVPLITPFGVFCLCMKHYIDRYNIFFVYGPSKINGNIHAAAINFVVIALIFMQICLFFFLFVRKGWTEMSVVCLGICIFTTMVFFTQISFHWFRVISPITYKKLSRRPSMVRSAVQPQSSLVVTDTKPFLPPVLKRSSSRNDVFPPCVLERSYGTNEDSIVSSPDDDEECVVVRREVTCANYQHF